MSVSFSRLAWRQFSGLYYAIRTRGTRGGRGDDGVRSTGCRSLRDRGRILTSVPSLRQRMLSVWRLESGQRGGENPDGNVYTDRAKKSGPITGLGRRFASPCHASASLSERI